MANGAENRISRLPSSSSDDAGRLDPGQRQESWAHIKVVGAGGAGGNAVDRMIQSGVSGVEFIAVNTDAQTLMSSQAERLIRIGDKLTKGLGAGGQPSVGEKAAEEAYEELQDALRGSDMVFIAVGMGGGTGTGSAPVIGEISRNIAALTVGVVTRPFTWEGVPRRRIAEEGVRKLREHVDTLITIPNDRILEIAPKNTPITEAFRLADEVLRQAVQGISDLITQPGLINLDFNDVKAIMQNSGTAYMAIGYGSGENRAADAVRDALANPLLEMSIDGAKGILLNFTGGPDMSLHEVSQAAEIISNAADPDAQIIFGSVIDETMSSDIQITVIATGFDEQDLRRSSMRGAAEPRSPESGDRPPVTPIGKEEMGEVDTEHDLDVPTFLRKRMNRQDR
ncbi:MAG: cell division protein FtsZ [Chloroflexota bacterium]|nr:cell division protein FtsZ [Chloroflexota bacterium]